MFLSCKWLIFSLLSVLAFLPSPAAGIVSSANDDSDTELERARRLVLEWNRNSIEESSRLCTSLANTHFKRSVSSVSIKAELQFGRNAMLLGKTDEAREIFKKVENDARSNGFQNIYSSAVAELFLIELNSGQTEAADETLNSLVRLRSSGEVLPETKALLSFAEAEFHYYRQNLDSAIEDYSNAVDLANSAGDISGSAKYRLYLAYAYLSALRYDESLAAMLASLERSKEAGDKRIQAFAHIGLGRIWSQLDERQRSLDSYKTAEAMFDPGVDLVEQARLYNGIGKIYEDSADYPSSLIYRKKALEAFRSAGHVLGESVTLPSLGILSYRSGSMSEAKKYFAEALELNKKTANRVNEAWTRAELGSLYFYDNEPMAAAAELERSERYFSEIGDRYILPIVQTRLSKVYLAQGRLADARQLLNSSLQLNRAVQNRYHEADTLFQLSLTEKASGNPDRALELAIGSVEISDSLYHDFGRVGLKGSFTSSVYDRYALSIQLQADRAAKTPDQDSKLKALKMAEGIRARTFIEKMSQLNARSFADADEKFLENERRIISELSSKSDQLTNMLSKEPNSSDIRRISDEVSDLKDRLDEIRSELKNKSPYYSAISDPEPFDIARFRTNALAEDEVLLEYFLGNDRSYLWLVTKNELEQYVLPQKSDIDERVDRLLELLNSRKPQSGDSIESLRSRVAEADRSFSLLSHELSDMLLGNVSDKLKGKRLIVVPDGKLHYLPLSALPFPNSPSDEPILLTNEVVYQPSAQTMSLLKTVHRDSRADHRKDFLIFSDPVFNREDPRLTGIALDPEKGPSPDQSFRLVESLETLPRLQSSGVEATSIQKIVSGSDVDSFSGFAASRERLMGLPLDDYRVLHFATHGFVNLDRPDLSSLVFSRFDKSGTPLNESVRMQDIYSMKLSADLVVLSACETGTGKEVKGEGVVGLNTAFLQAGSRSVLASLWPIEDSATNLIMTEFYEGMWNRGESSAESLRNAQIKLYRDPQFSSPFYWASFTLQGDPTVRVRSAGVNWRLATIAAVAFAACGLLYFFIRRRRVAHSAINV